MAAALPKVAIACQGGGSHAAFAAGVLQRVLAADLRDRYRLVGLSGTSGGAMCAALAWTGLQLHGADDAIERLGAFWDDVKAVGVDAIANFWGTLAARSPLALEVSPYDTPPLVEQRLAELIDRHVPLQAAAARRRDPRLQLLVAATDVLSGDRTVFGADSLTALHLLASAAVPPLFRAIEIGDSFYWDGLFCSNPPVREFTDETMMAEKPDQLWVVQINPQRRAEVPRATSDSVDRRNELAGNLSLAQELSFIEKVNELTAAMAKHPRVDWPYRHIDVKVLEMPLQGLDYASKLDRNPALIERLIVAGRHAGARFIVDADWPRRGSLPLRSRRVP